MKAYHGNDAAENLLMLHSFIFELFIFPGVFTYLSADARRSERDARILLDGDFFYTSADDAGFLVFNGSWSCVGILISLNELN